MPSLLELLDRAKKDKVVAYGDTTYLPITDTDSLNSDVGKYESKDTSLEKVLKKSLKNPLDIQNMFDKADRLMMDTRGIINPYRTTILTEKFQADTIGGEVLKQTLALAGSILKQRIRIADTIFPEKNKPGPISNILLQPQNAARGEKDIEKNKPYFVKTVFKPGAEILGGAARSAIQGDLRSAKQEALQAGLNLGRSMGRKSKITLDDTYIESSYHPASFDLNLDGRIGGKKGTNNGEEGPKTFFKFKEYYLKKADAMAFNGVRASNGAIKTLKERDPEEYKHHSDRMIDYLIAGVFPKGIVPEESLIPWVKFHPLGFEPMFVPGTISGLNEDVQPNWETYKYIGSPFNSYKYNGVERTLQFNIKLYWHDQGQIWRIKQQIEYLKQLCFPSSDISIAKYKNSPTGSLGSSDQLFYRPQFLELTIHGYSKKLFGFVENLSVNIPDDATWPSTNSNMEFSDSSTPPKGMDKKFWGNFLVNTIFPSNVDISVTFKVIENPHAELQQNGSKVKYNYNLDGMGFGLSSTIMQNKYPSRPSVTFVPEEPTKREETPVVATQTSTDTNKVTKAPTGKKSNKNPKSLGKLVSATLTTLDKVATNPLTNAVFPITTLYTLGKDAYNKNPLFINNLVNGRTWQDFKANLAKAKAEEDAAIAKKKLNDGATGN